MGGGDLNTKKSWHPNTIKNQERVWKAEKAAAEEKKRILELQSERAAERDRAELNSLAKRSVGGLGADDNRLHWMYEKPDKKAHDEDYLLGKTIEKNYDQPEKSDDIIPAIARRVVGSSMQTTAGDVQVDLVRKIREDPLLLVKERERAARAALLNNPLHRKRLTELLRKEQEHRKEDKKGKNSKKKDNDLDNQLAAKLNALGGEKRLNLATLLASDDSSSVSSDDESKKKKKKKQEKKKTKKSKKKKSEDYGTESSDYEKQVKQKGNDKIKKGKDNKKNKKSHKTKEIDSEDDIKCKVRHDMQHQIKWDEFCLDDSEMRRPQQSKRNPENRTPERNKNRNQKSPRLCQKSPEKYRRNSPRRSRSPQAYRRNPGQNNKNPEKRRSSRQSSSSRSPEQIKIGSQSRRHLGQNRSPSPEKKRRYPEESRGRSPAQYRTSSLGSKRRKNSDLSPEQYRKRSAEFDARRPERRKSSEPRRRNDGNESKKGLSEAEKAARLAAMAAAGAERERARAVRVTQQRLRAAAEDAAPARPAPRSAPAPLPVSLESRIHSTRHYIQRGRMHMNEHFARR